MREPMEGWCNRWMDRPSQWKATPVSFAFEGDIFQFTGIHIKDTYAQSYEVCTPKPMLTVLK